MLTRPLFRGIRPVDGQTIYGEMAAAAVEGQAVAHKDNGVPANDDPAREVELATSKNGYFLTRDVKAHDPVDALKRASLGVIEPNFKTPFLTGGEVSARKFAWVEAEGSDFLAGTLVGGTTVIDGPLTFDGGKLRDNDDLVNKETVGWLRRYLSPVVGGNTRAHIEMAV